MEVPAAAAFAAHYAAGLRAAAAQSDALGLTADVGSKGGGGRVVLEDGVEVVVLDDQDDDGVVLGPRHAKEKVAEVKEEEEELELPAVNQFCCELCYRDAILGRKSSHSEMRQMLSDSLKTDEFLRLPQILLFPSRFLSFAGFPPILPQITNTKVHIKQNKVLLLLKCTLH